MNLLGFDPSSNKKDKGFSLVELMVAVGIITVLASLAVPRFQVFLAKSRQSEAKSNLYHMYTLQEAHHSEYSVYSRITAVGKNRANQNLAGGTTANGTCTAAGGSSTGFNIDGCIVGKIRYQYTASTGAGAQTWTGSALSGVNGANQIVPSCATEDIFRIDERKNLQHASNSILVCL